MTTSLFLFIVLLQVRKVECIDVLFAVSFSQKQHGHSYSHFWQCQLRKHSRETFWCFGIESEEKTNRLSFTRFISILRTLRLGCCRLLAILDDQAVIIHGHSVKGIEWVVRCYENANETSRVLDVEETKCNLVSTRISYVLCTSFSFWIRCTIATKKGIFLPKQQKNANKVKAQRLVRLRTNSTIAHKNHQHQW